MWLGPIHATLATRSEYAQNYAERWQYYEFARWCCNLRAVTGSVELELRFSRILLRMMRRFTF
jgi:hypothetical protein